ncbi:MAG: helix-turn-helix domain-containing protein [Coriobacteriia bacterium]|nr:helix-turn-helix domain-containing protein [Coriobacteriia bacterium]
MDLEDLIRAPEGKTLEFKRDLTSPSNVLKTACSFANTSGGTIVIGIEDRTGTVRGVHDPLDAEERLASLVSDGITPRLIPDIDIVPWRNTHVLALRVHLGSSRPHHITSVGPDEGTYVRVGSTNRRADASMIAELTRTARGESFDEQPLAHLQADAIDLEAVRVAYDGIREVRPRDLRTLRLTVEHQGQDVPTAGGVLLFGKARSEEFPDAWVQAGRFKGETKAAIIDTADLRAYPVSAVEHAMAFVNRNTASAVRIAGARSVVVPEYPVEAVREAVINAVVHADYSQRGAPVRIAIFDDRLEVESPGLLLPGLTVPDLRAGVSKVRNRVIARVFRDVGLIEQWGSGIGRIFEACLSAGLPEPLLEEVGTGFRVTLFSADRSSPQVDEIDSAVMQALREANGLGTSEIAEHIRRTPRATRSRLQRLVDLGLVVQVGSSPNDPHRRYFMAEERTRYGR